MYLADVQRLLGLASATVFILQKSSAYAEPTTACLLCIQYASSGDENTECSTELCGPYQISEDYWTKSINSLPDRRTLPSAEFEFCAQNENCALQAVRQYLETFATDRTGDKQVTCEDYARTHWDDIPDLDPGCYNRSTYRRRFLSCLERIQSASG